MLEKDTLNLILGFGNGRNVSNSRINKNTRVEDGDRGSRQRIVADGNTGCMDRVRTESHEHE